MEAPDAEPPAREQGERPNSPDDDEPVLPLIAGDDSDLGWGDESGGRDDDWYRRERPPHHGG